MKLVVVLRRAHEDLEEGREFYELREPGLGDYFVARLFEDIASLAALHVFHPRHHGFHRLIASRFPFGIYYAVEGNAVHVVAVIDLRRRPASIRRRMRGLG
jgi:hypothetical protein